MFQGVTGRNFQIMLYFSPHGSFLSQKTVQTLMKCRILRHFIWVFTVLQSTHLGVCSIQRVKYIESGLLK